MVKLLTLGFILILFSDTTRIVELLKGDKDIEVRIRKLN
jgi:hypothetical protein